MGGKSSFLRQVALCVVLAQSGCFVPAASMKFTPFDAIYTRMGASDNIQKGQSTFFVEMSETSPILRKATEHSLVILDELGRGTSTSDGKSIAYATLSHIINNTKSICLFVTHYADLARNSEVLFRRHAKNYHMSFLEDETASEDQRITFLYKLAEGVVPKSFGINVARMAGLPKSVLQVAYEASQKFGAEEEKAKALRVGKTLTTKTFNDFNDLMLLWNDC